MCTISLWKDEKATQRTQWEQAFEDPYHSATTFTQGTDGELVVSKYLAIEKRCEVFCFLYTKRIFSQNFRDYFCYCHLGIKCIRIGLQNNSSHMVLCRKSIQLDALLVTVPIDKPASRYFLYYNDCLFESLLLLVDHRDLKTHYQSGQRTSSSIRTQNSFFANRFFQFKE